MRPKNNGKTAIVSPHSNNITVIFSTYKSTWVVVSDSLSISKCLQERIRFQDNLFYSLKWMNNATKILHKNAKFKALTVPISWIQALWIIQGLISYDLFLTYAYARGLFNIIERMCYLNHNTSPSFHTALLLSYLNMTQSKLRGTFCLTILKKSYLFLHFFSNFDAVFC